MTIVLTVLIALAMLLFTHSIGFWGVYIVLGFGVVALIVNELLMPAAMERVVVVDFDRRVITLRNFIYQHGFWDVWPKREVEISFDEILGVETIDARGRNMRQLVHTKHSRFTLHGDMGGSGRLSGIIAQISAGTPPINPLRRQWVISFAAGFVGLGIVALLGWMLGWI